MADSVMSKKGETEDLGKPQCQAFIPGLDRFADQAGVAISVLMAAAMLVFSLVYGFIIAPK